MAFNDLADELGRAIAQSEIVPYYQPIVDLQTRRLTGFELLAHWQHPIRQIIDPAEFMPLVERQGLIRVLTERLLQQACAHAANWPAHIRLSVNISSLLLRDTEIAERLFQVAYEARFPFHRLMFELTESAVIWDLELARSILGNLRSLGARLALDDFGTGYSGLHHLHMLPFDTLKLDATFVRSMGTVPESRKIVVAVVGLCRSLHLMAIADGIENEDQLETLRSLGYNSGQGWLFGRPTSGHETTSLLNAEPPTLNTDFEH